jgi:hypothetical protein
MKEEPHNIDLNQSSRATQASANAPLPYRRRNRARIVAKRFINLAALVLVKVQGVSFMRTAERIKGLTSRKVKRGALLYRNTQPWSKGFDIEGDLKLKRIAIEADQKVKEIRNRISQVMSCSNRIANLTLYM